MKWNAIGGAERMRGRKRDRGDILLDWVINKGIMCMICAHWLQLIFVACMQSMHAIHFLTYTTLNNIFGCSQFYRLEFLHIIRFLTVLNLKRNLDHFKITTCVCTRTSFVFSKCLWKRNPFELNGTGWVLLCCCIFGFILYWKKKMKYLKRNVRLLSKSIGILLELLNQVAAATVCWIVSKQMKEKCIQPDHPIQSA